jgi:SAM-dependent methyltransferase
MLNTKPSCRFCCTDLKHTFIDLGMSPLCESYVAADNLDKMEPFYPLHVYVCHNCFLVQLLEYVSARDIYSEYAYFSSYSDSWLNHAKTYVHMIIDRLDLGPNSQVIEIASNDGYLLQYFVQQGIPSLGIEPAANIAREAEKKGIQTIVKFFGQQTAEELVAEGIHGDLLLGNNVLAHVPDINDFVRGLKILLNPDGVITMEFQYLLQLMQENQFDTIYHEHFSYLSFFTVEKIFKEHGLLIFDVEKLPTHGGSLRIYACHNENSNRMATARLKELKEKETTFGVNQLETYATFTEKVKETKRKLCSLLIDLKRKGKSIAGYGAPGKGNTLLNYCGIYTDFIDYTVDRNPYKQGKYLPGTHIPIFAPEKIRDTKPDYIMILPWNLKDEIMNQIAYIREWGGKFIIPIPEVTVLR